MRMWKMALLFLVHCGDSVTCARTKEMVALWTIFEDKGNEVEPERKGSVGGVEREKERRTHIHERTERPIKEQG